MIEQSIISGEADYGSGQGQSFLLPPGGTAGAIQLHIGSVGNNGGSIHVRMWEATGAPGSYFTRVGTAPVAEGTLDRSDVFGTPGWFTISLDVPYTNATGTEVYLVFEIELLTSGSGGWNNYSYSNLNSYSGGNSVFWNGSQYAIRDGQDLTFRILDDPSAPPNPSFPKSSLTITVTPSVDDSTSYTSLTISDSIEGYKYTCYKTHDPSLPFEQWSKLRPTRTGHGGSLNWSYRVSTQLQAEFFLVKPEPERSF